MYCSYKTSSILNTLYILIPLDMFRGSLVHQFFYKGLHAVFHSLVLVISFYIPPHISYHSGPLVVSYYQLYCLLFPSTSTLWYNYITSILSFSFLRTYTFPFLNIKLFFNFYLSSLNIFTTPYFIFSTILTISSFCFLYIYFRFFYNYFY